MRFYNRISSMTTGLILLAFIGIASVAGTILWPDTFFQTTFFRLLLLLLFINMFLCTCGNIYRLFQGRKQLLKRRRLLLYKTTLVLLHAGIVFILIGTGLYSCLGYTAELNILEGDTVDIDKVLPTANPFRLQLRDFSMTFNEDGSPAQYYSDLRIAEPGQPVHMETISVNHPLSYAGIKAYQSSYGYLLDTRVEDGNAAIKTALARDGDFINFAATKKCVKIFKYIPNYDPKLGLDSKSLVPNNPKIVYSVYEGTNLLGVGIASFKERIKIDKDVFIVFQQARPFSVLTLKSDPGLPLVAAGGLFLMLGISITLFIPRNGKKSRRNKEE